MSHPMSLEPCSRRDAHEAHNLRYGVACPGLSSEDELFPRTSKELAFTGTREGLTHRQLKTLKTIFHYLHHEGYTRIHLGDARGADHQAYLAASGLFFRVGHPASEFAPGDRAFDDFMELERPLPPLTRNHVMVNVSSLLVAGPRGFAEEVRSGTWATVRYARRLEREIIFVWPDGSAERGR